MSHESLRRTFVNPLQDTYVSPSGWWFDQTLDRLLVGMAANPGSLCGTQLTIDGTDLLAKIEAAAGWLAAKGVGHGHAVAWQFPNCPELAVLYWATWRLGAVAVPFHPQITATEATSVLTKLNAPVVLLAHAGSPAAEITDAILLPTSPDLSSALSGSPRKVSVARPDDLAVVFTTSGSSGAPKSVMHSHRTLAHKARQLPTLHGTGSGDAVLVPAAMAHMAGFLHGVLHPVVAGVKAVLMEHWDADVALELIRREQVTMLFGPPVFPLGIAGAAGFSSEAVKSVRLIASGGTSISESYVEHVQALFGAKVKRTYGSTEAPIVSNTFPGDDEHLGWSTDGRAVPGAELEVRDVETGAVLPDETEGELWIRGPELCEGYADVDQTAAAFVDGWFRTCDLAIRDRQGYIRICGRISGLIIRGGLNISAREVEIGLEAHPDVTQAVVLGFPDEIYGERVAAFITGSAPMDRQACVAWFAERGIAKYKVPDRIVRLPAMPTLAGYQKPDLGALRAILDAPVSGV